MKKKNLLKKALILTSVTVISLGGLVGCNSRQTDSGQTADTQTGGKEANTSQTTEYKTVRIGCGDATNNQLNDLAAVAQAEGYFEKELNQVGYTLEVTGFQGQGPEICSAIMSGALDGGNIAEFPAYNSKSSGSDISVIGVTNPKFLYGLLAVDENIKNVTDLEGKKVVVQQGTALQYAWEQIVELTGIDASKIEVVNASVLDGISLLQTGDADVIISAKYSLNYYAQSGLGHLVEGVPDDASSTTLIVLDNDYIAENPDVPVALNKALIEAYEDVQENPQLFYETVGKKMGDGGADVIQKGYEQDDSISYLTPEFSDGLYEKVKSIYNWQKDKNLLSGDVDVDSFFDSSYYDKALEQIK